MSDDWPPCPHGPARGGRLYCHTLGVRWAPVRWFHGRVGYVSPFAAGFRQRDHRHHGDGLDLEVALVRCHDVTVMVDGGRFLAQSIDHGDGLEVLVAWSTLPALRGIRWRWSGGRLVDYHLAGHPIVGCMAVPYDWPTGTVVPPFTLLAFVAVLDDHYANPDNVTATVDDVAMA